MTGAVKGGKKNDEAVFLPESPLDRPSSGCLSPRKHTPVSNRLDNDRACQVHLTHDHEPRTHRLAGRPASHRVHRSVSRWTRRPGRHPPPARRPCRTGGSRRPERPAQRRLLAGDRRRRRREPSASPSTLGSYHRLDWVGGHRTRSDAAPESRPAPLRAADLGIGANLVGRRARDVPRTSAHHRSGRPAAAPTTRPREPRP